MLLGAVGVAAVGSAVVVGGATPVGADAPASGPVIAIAPLDPADYGISGLYDLQDRPGADIYELQPPQMWGDPFVVLLLGPPSTSPAAYVLQLSAVPDDVAVGPPSIVNDARSGTVSPSWVGTAPTDWHAAHLIEVWTDGTSPDAWFATELSGVGPTGFATTTTTDTLNADLTALATRVAALEAAMTVAVAAETYQWRLSEGSPPDPGTPWHLNTVGIVPQSTEDGDLVALQSTITFTRPTQAEVEITVGDMATAPYRVQPAEYDFFTGAGTDAGVVIESQTSRPNPVSFQLDFAGMQPAGDVTFILGGFVGPGSPNIYYDGGDNGQPATFAGQTEVVVWVLALRRPSQSPEPSSP